MKTVPAKKSLSLQITSLLTQLFGLSFLFVGFYLGKDLWEREESIWPSFIFAGPGLFMIGACYIRYGPSLISKIICCSFVGISLIAFIGLLLFLSFKG